MSQNHDEKDFDGIIQSGNDFPAWYKHIFVYAIVFAVGYVIYFHGFSKWGTPDHFAGQVADHEEKFPKPKDVVSADGSNPLRGNATAVAEGEKTFKAVCAACHGVNAEGVVGPSLVDKDWIHGNTDAVVYANVMKGISIEQAKLGRGPMPAHEVSLGSEKIYQVMAWLASKNDSLVAK
jgi:cytochrome c oxidase cbb3-type subunit 3